MSNTSNFYKILRELCEQKNLTVTELATSLGLSSGSPTAWKNGAKPRESTVYKIADALCVSPYILLGSEEVHAQLTKEQGKAILDFLHQHMEENETDAFVLTRANVKVNVFGLLNNQPTYFGVPIEDLLAVAKYLHVQDEVYKMLKSYEKKEMLTRCGEQQVKSMTFCGSNGTYTKRSLSGEALLSFYDSITALEKEIITAYRHADELDRRLVLRTLKIDSDKDKTGISSVG